MRIDKEVESLERKIWMERIEKLLKLRGLFSQEGVQLSDEFLMRFILDSEDEHDED